VDVRIVAATHSDLLKMVAEGSFREDLFYRLNVIPVHMPPLRDRREDVPLLVQHFLQKLGSEQSPARIVTMSQEALRLLMSYDWPGNVRQLENVVERALAFTQGRSQIEVSDLGPDIQKLTAAAEARDGWLPDEGIDLERYMEGLELSLIRRSLERTQGNKVQAARLLNLKRTTLIEKLKRLQRSAVANN
jgi:DNA-binding NtrC family response regulator